MTQAENFSRGVGACAFILGLYLVGVILWLLPQGVKDAFERWNLYKGIRAND